MFLCFPSNFNTFDIINRSKPNFPKPINRKINPPPFFPLIPSPMPLSSLKNASLDDFIFSNIVHNHSSFSLTQILGTIIGIIDGLIILWKVLRNLLHFYVINFGWGCILYRLFLWNFILLFVKLSYLILEIRVITCCWTVQLENILLVYLFVWVNLLFFLTNHQRDSFQHIGFTSNFEFVLNNQSSLFYFLYFSYLVVKEFTCGLFIKEINCRRHLFTPSHKINRTLFPMYPLILNNFPLYSLRNLPILSPLSPFTLPLKSHFRFPHPPPPLPPLPSFSPFPLVPLALPFALLQ